MSSRISANWRLRSVRYRLTGTVCKRCGYPMIFARHLCQKCVQVNDIQHTCSVELAMDRLLNCDNGILEVGNHSDYIYGPVNIRKPAS